MKEPKAPTIDELLAEVFRPSDIGEGKGTQEWCETWGVSNEKARKIIRHALETGRMRSKNVLRANPFRPNGRLSVPVYEWTKNPKKK